MTLKLARKKASEVSADLVAILVREGKETSGAVSRLPKAVHDAAIRRAKKLSYKGKPGSTLLVQADGHDLLLVGVGDGKSSESWRRAASSVRASAGATRATTVALALDDAEDAANVLAAVAEGFLLASYSYDKYRSSKKSGYSGPKALTISSPALSDGTRTRAILEAAESTCEAVCFARDLINEIPSVKVPSHLAAAARTLTRGSRVRCEIWQGEKLRREKMNGILGVSAGSRNGGALIHLTYKPARRAKATVAIVGKGITFDSGGLSLKPAKGMETMKMDMSGAAMVLGIMKALPTLAPSVEVHGFVAAAENMPGHAAQKPGDIIRFRNGKTAEVLNTDAEGRLVLADLLSHLRVRALAAAGPELFSIATLTGHASKAVGPYSIAIENGPARRLGTAQRLASAGELWADPFEISRLRREDWDFVRPRSTAEDVLSCNNAPSVATPRGHQFPMAFLAIASGLDEHGGDSARPLPFTHLDIAGSFTEGGDWQFGRPTGAPVAALCAALLDGPA
jgi:leucyl aminopeptidase